MARICMIDKDGGSSIDLMFSDVDFHKCSDYDNIYVLNGDGFIRYLRPLDICYPDVYINKNLELVTKRPVKAGEDLAFAYNNNGEPTDEWAPILEFQVLLWCS
ncbi:hypothetical protein BJ742DRAFT_745517 [Cladochytrium replicatum]|nr:hypothetical protein BJ742DRAFT_745517 [Cladochytrium replicatum]